MNKELVDKYTLEITQYKENGEEYKANMSPVYFMMQYYYMNNYVNIDFSNTAPISELTFSPSDSSVYAQKSGSNEWQTAIQLIGVTFSLFNTYPKKDTEYLFKSNVIDNIKKVFYD